MEELRAYAVSGYSLKETAAKLGVTYGSLKIRAQRAGIKFKRPPSTLTKANDPSREKMRDLYRKGETLQKIGDRFGITRERVRQILAKNYGIDTRNGGARLVARRRAISGAARQDAL